MRNLILAAAALLLLVGPTFAQTRLTEPAPPAVLETDQGAYQLGPGDRLRITVFGEEELTGEYQVGANGTLAFPLVGEVPAANMTPQQFASALATRLRQGYLREPHVAASVIGYRPFYILGEVQTPGTYPYAANIDVLSAVAIAGGFTYRANRGRVFIRRAGENEERAYRLRDEAVRVFPGDTVRIGERFF